MLTKVVMVYLNQHTPSDALFAALKSLIFNQESNLDIRYTKIHRIKLHNITVIEWMWRKEAIIIQENHGVTE